MFALEIDGIEGTEDCFDFEQPKVASTILPLTIASDNFAATGSDPNENRRGNNA